MFGGAFLVRLAYLIYARPPFDGVYWVLAGSLRDHGSLALDGVRTTEYEPLYPVFLACCRVLAGDNMLAVQILQVIVGSLGAVLLQRLMIVATGRGVAAAIGGTLYGIHPILVRQAPQHSEAALMTVLLLAFTYAFVRARTAPWAAASGVALGLAVLTRSMALPLVVLAAGLLTLRRQYRLAAAFTAAALVVVLILPLRNHGVNGSWFPTRSGMNLFVGNHPFTSALLPEHDVDLLQPYGYALVARELHTGIDDVQAEVLADAILTKHAIAFMTGDPGGTLLRTVRNVGYFFWPRPVPYYTMNDETRLVVGSDGSISVAGGQPRPIAEVAVYAVVCSAVLAAALCGLVLFRARLREDAILLCIAITFVAVHAVYFPATRYRGPMAFVLLFYAALASERLLQTGERREPPRV